MFLYCQKWSQANWDAVTRKHVKFTYFSNECLALSSSIFYSCVWNFPKFVLPVVPHNISHSTHSTPPCSRVMLGPWTVSTWAQGKHMHPNISLFPYEPFRINTFNELKFWQADCTILYYIDYRAHHLAAITHIVSSGEHSGEGLGLERTWPWIL